MALACAHDAYLQLRHQYLLLMYFLLVLANSSTSTQIMIHHAYPTHVCIHFCTCIWSCHDVVHAYLPAAAHACMLFSHLMQLIRGLLYVMLGIDHLRFGTIELMRYRIHLDACRMSQVAVSCHINECLPPVALPTDACPHPSTCCIFRT